MFVCVDMRKDDGWSEHCRHASGPMVVMERVQECVASQGQGGEVCRGQRLQQGFCRDNDPGKSRGGGKERGEA